MKEATNGKDYQGWRKAAYEIAKMQPGEFVAVEQLEHWFGSSRKEDKFNFAWMHMVEALLDDGVCLTRISKREDGSKGWFVATDEVKAKDLLSDADRAIRRRIRRQRRIIEATDVGNLSDDAKRRLDFFQRRNAFLQLSSDATRRSLPAAELVLRLPEKSGGGK